MHSWLFKGSSWLFNGIRPKPFYFWIQCREESDPKQNDSIIEFSDRLKID